MNATDFNFEEELKFEGSRIQATFMVDRFDTMLDFMTFTILDVDYNGLMVQLDGVEVNNGEIFCAYDPESLSCEAELVD